jgi:transcription antitermination factor NusG
MSTAWYAIRVRSNFEQTTSAFLTANGYEAFLPTYRERRQWSDRVKEIDAPLFRGYVFCQMDVQVRQVVVRAPGFLNIVSAGSTFLPVADSEIDAVRTIVNSPVFRMPWPYLSVGERVVIDRGPLAGVEGILLEQKNEHRLIVSVNLLQRSIAAEVSLDCVRPVKQSFRIPFEAACRAVNPPRVGEHFATT